MMGLNIMEDSKDKTILEEASDIIYGDRESDYGSATGNHQNIANFWGDYLGCEISPKDVVYMMILLKIARGMHKDKRDNLVDIAGYAGCLEKIEKGL